LRDALTGLLADSLEQLIVPPLDLLDDAEFFAVKLLMASNPDTPTRVLHYLAIQSPPQILSRIAENPNTSVDMLLRLARHNDPTVRASVADNEHTPCECLERLALDEHPDVRYRLAENYLAPAQILETLANDDNPFVSHRAQTTQQRLRAEELAWQESKQRVQSEAQDQTTQGWNLPEGPALAQGNVETRQSAAVAPGSANELELQLCELARTNAELQMARDQALESSGLKSAFVANISHELRTPLSAIVGMNELLLSAGLSKEQRGLAQSIQDSAQTLLSIVDDISDIGRIETQQLDCENIPFNIIYVVQDSARLMKDLANSKKIVLITRVDQRIPEFIVGDPGRIREVILTLLGSSIKLMDHGEVSLEALVEAEDEGCLTLRFSVIDRRAEASAEGGQAALVQASPASLSDSAQFGRAGLSLTIARKLAESMGGRLELAATAAEGSRVSVIIPFRRPQQQPQAPVASIGSAPTPAPRPANQLVLVVEDNPVLQSLATRQLTNLGIQSQSVSNGKEAIAAVKEVAFDLILMDCFLPELDGFEATRAIRTSEAQSGRHTPIIAMTARAMKGDAEKCMAAGMDDYLSKPVSIELLRQKIEQWLPLERRARLTL